jgi:hypothetical protein
MRIALAACLMACVIQPALAQRSRPVPDQRVKPDRATSDELRQPRRAVSDEQIVREARLAASGNRVEIYQHGIAVNPALLNAAEKALAAMEEKLGHELDEERLGRKIRIYVSAFVGVSHVWQGYDHPRDPRGIVFLNPRVAHGATDGTDATYAHEMAHLLTWRFRSHTLREGFADYLALAVHPGAGIGPNPQGYGAPPSVGRGIETYIGTTKSPPAALNRDLAYRRAYYYASYRFVNYLIQREGLATFLELYYSKNPEKEYSRLYGASRADLVRAAGS